MDTFPGKPTENEQETIIDDTIVWTDDMEESFNRICSMLSHCNKKGMVFSPDKFQFAKETIEFAGFLITMKGIKLTDRYLQTIRNFQHQQALLIFVAGMASLIKLPMRSAKPNSWPLSDTS